MALMGCERDHCSETPPLGVTVATNFRVALQALVTL